VTLFALVDGNSFYCSCERAFDPQLRGKPVVVLSNNDGCVIARTQEAKNRGVKMAEPWHMASKRPGAKDIIWMSSNYALYGDMSRRLYEVLAANAPAVEPYSIDEMFLDLTGVADPVALAHRVRAEARRIAKIPTCVGIGPTKTIAKLANKAAKSYRTDVGICDLSTAAQREETYAAMHISDVWGLGPAAVAKLATLRVTTVADFMRLPNEEVRELLTVTGARTHKELGGVSCIPFSQTPATRKSLAITRSFGRAVTRWPEMEQALAAYATRAAEKLRRHGLVAGGVQVFMRTNPFNKDPRYFNQATFGIETTADTLVLIKDVIRAGERLWRDGYRYAKAGVVLVDLTRPTEQPRDLFPSTDRERRARLMAALDTVNMRYGRRTLSPATAGIAHASWSMRRQKLSPQYTTRVDEILSARA
jgi:DNA polymerase V